MARHMLMVGTEVHTMLAKMSIGCLMVSLTGCVAATEDEAAAPSSAALYGHVFELGSGVVAQNALLGDVEVCTMAGDRCTTSERGIYWLEGLQPDSRSEVSFRKAGYVSSFVQAGVTEYNGVAEAGLMSVAGARAFAEAAGASPLGETGGIVVMIMEPGQGMFAAHAGGTFAVHATTSVRSIYADDSGLADAALKSTSSAGWGAAFGIAPGTITVEALDEAGGRRCGSWSEQASELASSAQVQVRAGELSVVTMICL